MKQVEDLIVQLDEAHKESDFFQDKLILAENEIRRLQSELFTSNQEKESLGHTIQQKNQESEMLKQDIREKEAEIRTKRDVEAKFADLQVFLSLNFRAKPDCLSKTSKNSKENTSLSTLVLKKQTTKSET